MPYSQGDQKRKIEDGDDAIHMVEETSIEDDEMIIMSDVAVQDGGAASFLGSYAKIRGYIFYLMDKGLPDQQDRSLCMQEGLQVWQFREGGGHYTCLMLPIFAGHKRRHVLCYAVRGTCPILIGRPLLEKLGLMVDFSTRQYRWEGQQWKPVILGRKNEYLIRLAENYKELIREEPEKC